MITGEPRWFGMTTRGTADYLSSRENRPRADLDRAGDDLRTRAYAQWGCVGNRMRHDTTRERASKRARGANCLAISIRPEVSVAISRYRASDALVSQANANVPRTCLPKFMRPRACQRRGAPVSELPSALLFANIKGRLTHARELH